jgi:hypothetical protein
MSVTSEITTLLNADSTFKAAITAGAFDAVEISRQLTAGAFDTNNEIKPCALVKTGQETKAGNKNFAVQTTLTIYLYQRSGYVALDAGLARLYALLHQRHSLNVWEILFENEVARAWDDALNCSMAVQRYTMFRKK